MARVIFGSRARLATVLLAPVLAATVLAGCTSATPTTPTAAPAGTKRTSNPATASAVSTDPSGASAERRKVMLVVEENRRYDEIIGSGDAPRINDLAHRYGLATAMTAGYPVPCPSLAAYLLLTGGVRHGICDDKNPAKHMLDNDNVFEQVASAGLEYRAYAESMPVPCADENSDDGRYLVRHAPVPYYSSEVSSGRCKTWDIPMGGVRSGALHDAVASGTLPALSVVTPDACHDMHGARPCGKNTHALTRAGDEWLARWMDQITSGPDYRGGRLTVIVTWDEGDRPDNHIPTLVVSPSTHGVRSTGEYTHCSTLRTIEDELGLPQLGCAADAPSMVRDFGLS